MAVGKLRRQPNGPPNGSKVGHHIQTGNGVQGTKERADGAQPIKSLIHRPKDSSIFGVQCSTVSERERDRSWRVLLLACGLTHFFVPYPTLPYSTLPYSTLPYPILPYHILPYPILPCPTLTCPTLTSPHLTSAHITSNSTPNGALYFGLEITGWDRAKWAPPGGGGFELSLQSD